MGDETTIDAGPRAVSADEPRAYLLVRQGDTAQVLHLDEGAVVLFGRSREATVQIDDPRVSREHLRIVNTQGVLRAQDLGGRNGTILNAHFLGADPWSLRIGDQLTVGDAQIVVAASTPSTNLHPHRLDVAIGEAMKATGKAAVVRLPIDGEELATLSTLFSGTRLVEAQADGDYACVLDDPQLARALETQLKKRTPPIFVGIARAPEDGTRADTLWHKSRASTGAPSLPPAPPGVIVADVGMVLVYEQVRKVAPTPTTVLILGETGAGKEVVAEQLHQQSPRRSGAFIRLNCGSLPETLLESELFGHEKGAFTGADKRKEGYLEAASGGTLFLDEIGELPLAMQTRLLRVLETRRFMRVGGRTELEVDVRFVAATNRDLSADVKSGRFREDLYFRLSTFIVRLPPLRQRPAEVALLAELFCRELSMRMGVPPRKLSTQALALLQRHAWPGNVRELRNAMERAVVLADEGTILPAHLPEGLGDGVRPEGAMREQIADVERKAIQAALEAEGGVQTRAAKRLGISRRALQYKLEKLRG